MSKEITKKALFLYGPTASGKTDFAYEIAKSVPVEIINMDSAQMYTPLTIGTAKPDWQNSSVPEHLFDILDEPKHMTAYAYRALARDIMHQVWSRGNIPLFVGGSGFYLNALFFPPLDSAQKKASPLKVPEIANKELWKQLEKIDPERAAGIHPHDYYRIRRALEIWFTTGNKPSLYKPVYNPLAPFVLIHVTRERKQLYSRINSRALQMMQKGWLEEVKGLIGSPWEPFVQEKGFIGYAELVAYSKYALDLPQAIDFIQQRSRNYAKRQETFWRMLKKKILATKSVHGKLCGTIAEFDLTLPEHALYIKQLLYDLLTCSDSDI